MHNKYPRKPIEITCVCWYQQLTIDITDDAPQSSESMIIKQIEDNVGLDKKGKFPTFAKLAAKTSCEFIY